MKKNVSNLQSSGNLMKILSLMIMLAFIAPFMVNAQAGKANFAGKWTFNAEKSTPAPTGGGGGGGGGGGARGGLGDFVATQTATTLTTVTTRTGQDGTPTTRTVAYTLDGKENTLPAPTGGGGGGGGAASKYVATWSADGKTLTIVTTTTFNDTPMKTTAAWVLNDAKTLTISTTRPGRDGGAETTTKRVYEIK